MPSVNPSIEPGGGIIAFKSNSQIEEEKRQARIRAAENQTAANEHAIDRLAAHCRSEWNRAREGKQPIETIMLRSMRAREGVYDEAKLNAIRQMGGSEIKMMLTDVKCRAAIAWITDVLLGTGERPFSCEHTPIPDIPPEIEAAIEQEALMELQQILQIMPSPRDVRERVEQYKDLMMEEAKKQAKRMAARMEDKIDDDYVEGEFYDALDASIDDFVTFPFSCVKGPVVMPHKELKWAMSDDPVRPNAVKAVVTKKHRRMFYCASPWDIYFTPEAKNSEQGSLIERHRLEPGELYEFIGTPGYNDEEIRAALRDYADSGLKDWLWNDSERSRLEKRPYETVLSDGNLIDAIEVWTKVKGGWLQEWGMEGIEDPERWYNACCWVIGSHVIRATLNDDPLGKRPYHVASYVPVRNSPIGRGVPELMNDLQNMCDAAARSISNNMGLGSGPMVEVETDRLASGEKLTQMQPWRIFQTTANKSGAGSPAVRFFQPPLVVDVLMATFEFFSNLADEYTGIPRYQYGDGNVGGAGKTAAGLSMLMNASSRTMKGVIKNLDKVIIGVTKRTHRHIMLFDDDMPGKGDVKIVARATQAIMHREAQQLRLNEAMNNTNNPIDFQIMGPKGRLELLRASLRGLDAVDVDRVLPSNDDMLMREFGQNLAAAEAIGLSGGPQQPGGPDMPNSPQENNQGAM